ncbi:hypothetical protein F5Y14DRAFT_447298 [Nemania sp. NC0429]|nr:hypothetical protein F5Y14DRAFT_447298 [Nemania sp. NC0429]
MHVHGVSQRIHDTDPAAIVQESVELLQWVHTTLEKNPKRSTHLAVVARDIESLKSIMQLVNDNPMLQNDRNMQLLKYTLWITRLLAEVVKKQDDETGMGKGFHNFADSCGKGPNEQNLIEIRRDELMGYKIDIIRGIIKDLAPPGTSLNVEGVRLDGATIMQNGRVMSTPETRDFDSVTIRNVTMSGSSFMNNSSVTPEQEERIRQEESNRRKKQILLSLATNPAVPDKFRNQIICDILGMPPQLL